MKRIISLVVLLLFVIMWSGCKKSELLEKPEHVISLMTDTGGIHDQAFNQNAWEGFLRVKDELNFGINYLESKQVADYKLNLDSLTDMDPDMIFVMGYTAADILRDVAKQNPNQRYTIIDYKYEEPIENILSVKYKDQEAAFLVGYIAAYTTKTNNIGFIGGDKSEIIDGFEFGFRAGVAIAAKELNKKINVEVQYAANFQDDTKGKAMANVMYSSGIDIIYHAAGNLGRGVIEAAKENGKYVIGADRDQNYLAPENVISSTIKRSSEVIYQICKDIKSTDDIGKLTGQNREMGLKENVVGIAESTKDMISQELMNKVEDLKEKIINDKLEIPYNEETFNAYIKNL